MPEPAGEEARAKTEANRNENAGNHYLSENHSNREAAAFNNDPNIRETTFLPQGQQLHYFQLHPTPRVPTQPGLVYGIDRAEFGTHAAAGHVFGGCEAGQPLRTEGITTPSLFSLCALRMT